MRILLEGEARYGGRWGTLEVDLKVGSPTSAAALLSELVKSKLISGVGVHIILCSEHRERIIDLRKFLSVKVHSHVVRRSGWFR